MNVEKITNGSNASISTGSHEIAQGDANVPFIPASLTVSKLQYEITVKEELKEGEKKGLFKKQLDVQRAILSNVDVKASPGRVLAIMGPSGSGTSPCLDNLSLSLTRLLISFSSSYPLTIIFPGKTTLLDLLADRQARNVGKIQGEILLNDVPVKQYGNIRKRLVGYVTQEDGKYLYLSCAPSLPFLFYILAHS